MASRLQHTRTLILDHHTYDVHREFKAWFKHLVQTRNKKAAIKTNTFRCFFTFRPQRCKTETFENGAF